MLMTRVLLAIAAVLFSATSLGASLADRSPFVQGHWFNRDRPGSGFDVFNAADQVAIVWYTYDESSRPVWYIAQGARTTMGTQAWPLVQESWSNGRLGTGTAVGSVKLETVDPETLSLTWNVGGHSGQWNIVPLIASGIESEIDHSGHWFDPTHGGWGFNVTEQGDVLGTVIYAYDASGAPTWVAGFGRDADKKSVDVYSTSGSCPWCAYRGTSTVSAGKVSFEYRSESDLVIHSTVAVPMAQGVSVDGTHATQLGRPASTRPADRQLAAFDSDASLKSYLGAGMLNLPFPGGGGVSFSPAPPGSGFVPFSTTNLQEQGVDEADVVKSDGRFAYAFRHDSFNVREPVIRMAAIGADGSSLGTAGTAPLTDTASVAQAGLYLSGIQLAAIVGTQPLQSGASFGWTTTTAWANGKTNVEVFDVSSPASPTTRWRAQIDGHLIASRRIGNKLYVVSRFVPFLAGFSYGVTSGPAFASNQSLLAGTPLNALMPQVRINGAAPVALVATSNLFAPPQGSTPPEADIVVVTTVDLAAPGIVQTLGVVGPVEALYVSPQNLYLATRRGLLRSATGGVVANASSSLVTDLHQFALGADAVKFVGSASLEGFLASDPDQAPFRMSESQGRLRVVTSTTQAMGWGMRSQANTLTIVEPSTITPGLLRTVSILPNVARPETLGKPFEELYATRYVGDRLYAVTFTSANLPQVPRVDPLYAIDLSNASDPKILGNLVIPGFSDYLHPLANGLLLGFGRVVTTTTGIQQGLQLSLFDVSGSGAPRVIQQVSIGKRGSDSALLRDHHAISVLARPDGNVNVAFPARIHDGQVAFGTGDNATYAWLQSGLMRYEVRLDIPQAPLNAFAPLITEQMPALAPLNDAAAGDARAIQFPLGTLYVANGRFWLQSSAGTVTGPF
jgi:uncharacterized secreted protein with C-terminal beta-propeller domain